MNFSVEGRYFEDSLTAFTFAGIQADRMDRPVEVRLPTMAKNWSRVSECMMQSAWHATAHPTDFKRRHLS